jgi:hypothetical protein
MKTGTYIETLGAQLAHLYKIHPSRRSAITAILRAAISNAKLNSNDAQVSKNLQKLKKKKPVAKKKNSAATPTPKSSSGSSAGLA